MSNIELNWIGNIGNVIEHYNGQSFVIGTVRLDILSIAAVGFTYFHHLLPLPEGAGSSSLSHYENALSSHKKAFRKLKARITLLHQKYAEISVASLQIDEPEFPQFIDIAIQIRFPLPLPLIDYPHRIILDQITPYIELLGSTHELEIVANSCKSK